MDGSDGSGVDFVVFCMRADEANKNDACIVMDFDDESVVVALDIKNDAVAWKNVGGWVGLFDCRWSGPTRITCFMKPST